MACYKATDKLWFCPFSRTGLVLSHCPSNSSRTLFPIHSFLQSLFPKRAGTSPILKILSRRNTDLIKHIDVLFRNFSFLFSHVTERVVLLTISCISPSAISTYMLLKLGLLFMRAHTRTPTHTTQQLSRLAYIISTRPECLILPLFVLCIDSHIW